MRKTDGQSGSTHVVLIVVLIVIVLGGIGYIGYRALSKKTETMGASSNTSNASPVSSSASRELGFDSWKVAVNIPKKSNLYVKQYVDFDGKLQPDSYEVYDTDFDRFCPTSWPNDTSIGSVTRAGLDQQADPYFADPSQTNREYFTKNPLNSAIYGDYAYYYIKPNGSYDCLSSQTDGNAAANALGDARQSFLSALASIHSTTK